MPELPEVETIRRQLEGIIGQVVVDVSNQESKTNRGGLQKIKNQQILGIRRFGKLLLIDTTNELTVAIHLKMTGRLNLLDPDAGEIAHTHAAFFLGNGKRLTFADARKFGFVHVLTTDEVNSLPFLKKLGKEPLKELTLEDFRTLCKKTARSIKVLLLDQQKIAGIGNIYDCDALWMAKINPRLPANLLSKKQTEKLFVAIEDVLREGINRGGASDNTYRNLHGGKGEYQDFFKVYGRTGKPCTRCGTLILRESLGGRGTFFCPKCQK